MSLIIFVFECCWQQSLIYQFENIDASITFGPDFVYYLSFDMNLNKILKQFNNSLGNGTVSKAEFQGAYASKLGGTPEHAEKVFGHLDTDGDGEITVTEITQLFKKLDKDGILYSFSFYMTRCASDKFSNFPE